MSINFFHNFSYFHNPTIQTMIVSLCGLVIIVIKTLSFLHISVKLKNDALITGIC
jgi:hypothetical protein